MPDRSLIRLDVGGPIDTWRHLGFDVRDERGFEVAGTWLRTDSLDGWAVTGGLDVVGGHLDGLPTTVVDPDPQRAGTPGPGNGVVPTTHPNGVIAVDHVVVATPSLGRTRAAFEAAGLPIRRVRGAGDMRQAFAVVENAVVEIVGPRDDPETPPSTDEAPARVWGVAFSAPDLTALVASARASGVFVGDAHPAVQQGREIASVARSVDLALAVAFMTPRR